MTPEPFEKWVKTESHGSFWLHSKPGIMSKWDFDGGDLGRGGADTIIRFQTMVERAYFIEVDDLREKVVNLSYELEYLKTVKGANWNLRDVRARKKACL